MEKRKYIIIRSRTGYAGDDIRCVEGTWERFRNWESENAQEEDYRSAGEYIRENCTVPDSWYFDLVTEEYFNQFHHPFL